MSRRTFWKKEKHPGAVSKNRPPRHTRSSTQASTTRILMLSIIASSAASDITLAAFDGTTPDVKFVELNDPVMGGQSTGTWKVDSSSKVGVFDGTVNDVPSLKAPGFIKAAADATFPDASAALAGDLVLTLRSSTPAYKGFRVSFASGTVSPQYSCAGGGSIPFSRGCFKAPFTVPESSGDDFVTVRVPFHSFSDKWSPSTGAQTTTCAQDADVCPTAAALSGIKRVEVWAEGVDGHVHLELQSIVAAAPSAAYDLAAERAVAMRPPAPYDGCSAAVQPKLRYNVSTRTQPTVPVPVDNGESLAEAVCCDTRALPFAEPQFLFMAPDIALFDKLPTSGPPTVFYDSVCGLPLFKAPVNRSLGDFKSDTTEHGWPSFRTAEIYAENIVTNMTTNFVTSKCGTHLGTYLPDAQGPRWCIDLSCVAGNPASPLAVVEAAK